MRQFRRILPKVTLNPVKWGPDNIDTQAVTGCISSNPKQCPIHKALTSRRSLLPKPTGLVTTAAIFSSELDLFCISVSVVSVSTLKIDKPIKNNLTKDRFRAESSGISLIWTLCLAIVAFKEHN